jgi:hypothetical protein
MRILLLLCAWIVCSGFTMPIEWIMPEDSEHEYFILEECRTSKNAKNCLRSGNGWKESQTIPGEWRMTMITNNEPGQRCYRIKAANAAGVSGPSDVKCGFN